MRHPDEGTLMALLDGEIPSDELAPITGHLSTCEECRARLDAARAMMSESDALIGMLGDGAPVEAAPVVIPLPLRSRTTLYRNLAWAATVVMATGLGYSMRDPGTEPAPPAVAMEPSLDDRVSTEMPMASAADATAQSVEQERPAAPPTMQAATAAPPPAAPPAPAAGTTSDLRARNADTANRAEKSAEPPAATPPTRPVAVLPLATGRTAARLSPPSAEAAAPMVLRERAVVGMESFAPIGFAEAIARLGGSIRLVDGLVPDRLEASSSTVRVVYPLETGELFLEQRRQGDSISVVLSGPVSADSLAVLRRRVR